MRALSFVGVGHSEVAEREREKILSVNIEGCPYITHSFIMFVCVKGTLNVDAR